MSNSAWGNLHKHYKSADWSKKQNIFAEQVIKYFPSQAKILELGSGLGQDAKFFAKNGYQVTATDLETESLTENLSTEKGVNIQKLDMTEKFPFENASFDVVYAHLSLHYFPLEVTKKIVEEIKRVLKKDGIVAVFTNTIDDPEYGNGKEIEKDYFIIEDKYKRYFSKESLGELMHDFETLLLDANGETYKDAAKGIHNLIRYIGKKYE